MVSAKLRKAMLIDLGVAYRYPGFEALGDIPFNEFVREVHHHLTVSGDFLRDVIAVYTKPQYLGNTALHGNRSPGIQYQK